MILMVTFSISCNNSNKQMSNSTKIPAFDLTTMDTTVKPCVDFDGYVNGNWKKHNPIPSTEGSWGSFDILDKETREVKIKGIINELLAMDNPKKGTEPQLIAGYYRSYMDTVTIAKRGISPIKIGRAQL